MRLRLSPCQTSVRPSRREATTPNLATLVAHITYKMQLLHSGRSKRLTLTARLVSLWAVAIAVLISAGVNAVLLEDHSCYKDLDPATATKMNCYNKGVTGECRAALSEAFPRATTWQLSFVYLTRATSFALLCFVPGRHDPD